jgi:phage terminase small subunit
MSLSKKHRLFADRYFNNKNAVVSYLDTYKCRETTARGSAHKLLKRPDIQEYLAKLEAKTIEISALESVIDHQEAMASETKIIRHNIQDLLDENGDVKEIKDWPRDLAYTIKDIEYAHMPVGSDAHGNAITEKYIRKIHFLDKGQALGRVERVLGMNAPETKLVGIQLTIRQVLDRIDGDNRGKLPQDCK